MENPARVIPILDHSLSIENIIKQLELSGVNLGDNPQGSIQSFIDAGLLPQPNNNHLPSWAVQRIIAIQDQLSEGKSIEDLRKEISKERRSFLSQATDLNSMVRVYKKFSSHSLFTFFTSLGVLILFSGLVTLSIVDPKNSVLVAGEHTVGTAVAAGKSAARIAVAPLGQTIVTIIKTSKSEDSKSADPLGLTNIEKEKLVIPENILQIDSSGDLNIGSGNITANSFKGSGENLTNIPAAEIVGVVGLSTLPWTEISGNFLAGSGLTISLDETSNEIAFTNTDLGSSQFIFKNIAVAGQSNVAADSNSDILTLAQGSNVIITTDEATATITIGVTGTVANADTLDLLDSTAFLRSNTSNAFSNGTLTLNAGTVLSILGSLSCTNCITDIAVADTLTISAGGSVAASAVTGSLGDAQISDTITAANYLPLSGGTVTGVSVFSSILNPGLRVGDLSTGYFWVGGSAIRDVAGNLVLDSGSATLQFSDQTILLDDGSSSTYIINTRSSAGNNILIIQNPGLGILETRLEGNLLLNGDWMTGIATIDVPNTTTFQVRDQTNVLFSVADVGTVGNATVTGTLTVNGGTINSTASQLTLQALGANADILIQGGLCIRDATACPDVAAGGLQVDTAGGSADDPGDVFDFAEIYDSNQALEQGDLVTAAGNRKVSRTTTTYDQGVIGIVSTHPAAVINEGSFSVGVNPTDFNPNKPWVALAGRVPTKVSAENGNIEPGDLLTSSSTPGVAMKATATGPTVGKALEIFSGTGVGKIMVFVANSYYVNLEDSATQTLQTKPDYLFNLISRSGEAVFSKLTAAVASFGKLIFGEIVVQKGAKSAGQSTLESGQNEIFIQSDKAHSDSLINLTPNSEPDGVLYVKEKRSGEGFIVGVKRIDQNSAKEIKFNWLILNQE